MNAKNRKLGLREQNSSSSDCLSEINQLLQEDKSPVGATTRIAHNYIQPCPNQQSRTLNLCGGKVMGRIELMMLNLSVCCRLALFHSIHLLLLIKVLAPILAYRFVMQKMQASILWRLGEAFPTPTLQIILRLYLRSVYLKNLHLYQQKCCP